MVGLGTGVTDQNFLLPSIGEMAAVDPMDQTLSLPQTPEVQEFAQILEEKLAPQPMPVPMPVEPVAAPIAQIEATPMQEFLTAIDKEANIKPEQWVNAMAKLPAETQLESPWQTADKIVSQLNVDEKGKDKVLALYKNLLTKLQDVEEAVAEMPQPKIKEDDKKISVEALIGLSAAGLLPIVAKNQKVDAPAPVPVPVQNQTAPVKEMPKNLEKIFNPKVETSDLVVKIDKEVPGQKIIFTKGTDVKTDSFEGKVDISQMQPIKTNEMPKMPDIPNTPSIQNVNPIIPQAATEEIELPTLDEKPVAFAKSEKSKNSFLMDDDISGEEQPLSSFISEKHEIPVVQNSKSLASMQYQMESKPETHKGRTLNTKEQAEEIPSNSKQQPDFFIDSMSNRASDTIATRSHVMTPAAVGGFVLAQTDDANTQEVIRNAQVMVRQGGGEVKVKLHPESLGEVNMRMVVDGDKVHLALDTTNQEAKKVIESTLNDLRTTLSASKLHLETVKVDVSARSDNQFSNHRFDQNGHAGRDQARSFLQNFREDNRNRHGAMAENNIPGRTSSPRRPPMGAAMKASYTNNSGQAGRLNLVA